MNTPIYEWDWIGNKRVGISSDRVRVESRNGAVEYVPERTCWLDGWDADDEMEQAQESVDSTPEDTRAYRCSECDVIFRADRYGKPRYCPECGARII